MAPVSRRHVPPTPVLYAATSSGANSAADSVSVSDAVTRQLHFGRTAADAASITDTAASVVGYHSADSVAVSDSVAGQRVFVRPVADGVSVADAASRLTTQVRTAVDAVAGITDAASVQAGLVRTATEAVAVFDNAAIPGAGPPLPFLLVRRLALGPH